MASQAHRLLCLFLLLALQAHAGQPDTSDMSYESRVDSTNRFKCLYGYFASKTGDHETAVEIFEDCIARWQDVYSMIWLAHLYEDGAGVEHSLEKSFELMRRGAGLNDEAGYSSLARYHYGVALLTGRGTLIDTHNGVRVLRQAAAEGISDACVFLEKKGHSCQPH